MNEQPGRQMEEMERTVKGAAKSAVDAVTDAAEHYGDSARKAAGAVRDRVEESDLWQSAESMADDTGARLSEAADYVRGTSADEVWGEVVEFVKTKPVQSLAVAAFLGFAIGRMRRR